MGSIQNSVRYCCVTRNNQILFQHNEGDKETENLASLCLERIPPSHKWYFETIGKETFGFLIEGDNVYFAIVDEGLGNPGILRFLEQLRDEYRKAMRRGSWYSFSGLSRTSLHEQLHPVVRNLISSLVRVTPVNDAPKSPSPLQALSPSPSDASDQIEVAASTKAPLLGKSCKHEQKKMKDHVIGMRDILADEKCKSVDQRTKVEIEQGSSNQKESLSLPKNSVSNSHAENINKWRRQVRLVLAIDAVICLVLLAIWLWVCRGLACTH